MFKRKKFGAMNKKSAGCKLFTAEKKQEDTKKRTETTLNKTAAKQEHSQISFASTSNDLAQLGRSLVKSTKV